MRVAETILPIANDPNTGTLEAQLLEALEQVHPDAVRIATAYLTPDGFTSLRKPLQDAGSVRLLLGERPFLNRRGPTDRLSQPNDEQGGPGENIDWHAFLEGDYPWLLLNHDERKALLESGEADPDALRTFNLHAWEKVRALVTFLQRDGVEVRRFLADQAGKIEPGQVLSHKTASKVHLHAKTYLFHGENEAFAAVGSSNLTRGGLNDNVELNLAVYDETLTADLAAWFDAKWLQGQDCGDELVRLLEACVLFGRRFTPWQVFTKALHAAYGRYLDLALSGEVAGRLAEFQQEAVSRCVALLDRHWGAMLCDSVGLGKTYEGLGVLAEFSRRRREADNRTVSALVIAPAQLASNWTADKLAAYGVTGEMVTMESLAALAPDEDELATESPHEQRRRHRKLRYLQGFDVILVDESHNFRNPATKRYRALQEIIRGGAKPDKRVLLLTATPINNTPWDLYHQLSLITRGDDTWYAGRGPITNLRSTFRAIEKGDGGAGLLDAMLLSLVRRTRHDIRALQDAGEPVELNGQPMRFPRHEIPKAVDYSLQGLYGGIYRQIIDTIEGLTFAVYDLEAYGVQTDAASATTEGRLRQRNRSFIGIMKTIFLKRMESSVVALTSTVRSIVAYLDLFLAELAEHDHVLTPKDAQRLRGVLGGSLPDDVAESGELSGRARRAIKDLPAAPADAADRERLRAAVTADRERLASLLASLDAARPRWEGGDDPKLQAVRDLLESLPSTDRHGVPTKAVIFTNYKDTADYLYRGLTADPDGGEGASWRHRSNLAGGQWIAKLTGADDQKRRLEVLSYFAPLAFNREMEPPDDPILQEKVAPFRERGIDVLIATDVLSEGQNLQDAQYLINYDLHWNPVRMIQRAGRIDRLFSPHDTIYIYNLMPEQELETLLKLVNRLTIKVASIEEMVGLDASVLGEQIEQKNFDRIMKLAAGGDQADAVYREGEKTQGMEDAFAELNRYVQLVKELGTESVADIPDGVYSIRVGARAGVFVMLRMPEALSGQVYWRFYPLDDPQPFRTAASVIPLIEATPEEERQVLPGDENPFTYLQHPLQAAIDQLGEEYKHQVGNKTPDDFSRRLAHLLARDDVMEADPTLWSALHQWRQGAPPAEALSRSGVVEAIRVIRQTPATASLDDVLPRLERLWQALTNEGLDRPIPKPPSHQPGIRDLELVCWELVLTKEQLNGHAAKPSTAALLNGGPITQPS